MMSSKFFPSILASAVITSKQSASSSALSVLSRALITSLHSSSSFFSNSFLYSTSVKILVIGFSPLLIAERLGHEKVETTLQIYSHLYPNKHSEVATKLEELNK